MRQLVADLTHLVAIPSVSVPGRIDEPLLEAHDRVAQLFTDAGVEVDRLDLPETAPIIIGEIEAPPGAPTVLLYSHYDVVPGGDEALWETPPFEPSERDGAIYGRGVADSKSNVLMHVGALRAWEGRPPVGIKICIEGHEEIGSGAFPDYAAGNLELFRADVLVIGHGQLQPGLPHTDDRPAWDGQRLRRGPDVGVGEAQRPVRRGRPRRAPRAAPCARLAAR
jgi:acetylornithine deacetylase/succinyl-diaminopimelate desuccinylase-like protein